ncbi:hypothetical protein QQ045_030853 [Rhodiola kirilowii]
MDSFHVHLKLKSLKRLGNVFRVIEVCVFLIAVSRVSFQFQFQFQVGEYVKRVFSILLSHRFVFVIGNVIVITLFAKSGKDSHRDQNPKSDPTPTQSYYELIEKPRTAATATLSETQGGYIEGETIGTESHTCSVPNSLERPWSARVQKQEDKLVLNKNKACFKRSYSECLEVENYVKPRRILRRTVTEGGKGAACGEVAALDGGGDGDGMSDEEFRVMVETFIAKQQRSLREEEKCLSFL